jgi:periplasmic divalent cation tolerance protein
MRVGLIALEEMDEFVVVYTTLPKRRKARQIGRVLVQERLVACANIFKIDSIFNWKGETEEVGEYALLMKTRAELYSQAEERIKELHPYEVPAIVCFPLVGGSEEFFQWIRAGTGEPREEN